MKRLKILTIWAVTIAFSAFAINSTLNQQEFKRVYSLGSSVDNFIMTNLQGKYISLSDYDDAKGFILIFTSSRCPYSQIKEEQFRKWDKKYDGMGYQLIIVDPTIGEKDIFNHLRKKLREKNYDFPYLLDGKHELTYRFDVDKIPHGFILNKEFGEHIIKYSGPVDSFSSNLSVDEESYLTDALEQILKSGPMEIPTVEITGCFLKEPIDN